MDCWEKPLIRIFLLIPVAFALQPHPEMEINQTPEVLTECILEKAQDCTITFCHRSSNVHCPDQCYINAVKTCGAELKQ